MRCNRARRWCRADESYNGAAGCGRRDHVFTVSELGDEEAFDRFQLVCSPPKGSDTAEEDR